MCMAGKNQNTPNLSTMADDTITKADGGIGPLEPLSISMGKVYRTLYVGVCVSSELCCGVIDLMVNV